MANKITKERRAEILLNKYKKGKINSIDLLRLLAKYKCFYEFINIVKFYIEDYIDEDTEEVVSITTIIRK